MQILFNRTCLRLIAVSLGLFLFPLLLTASDFEEGESYTGVKLGVIGSGAVDVAGHDVDHSTSLTAGCFFDFPFGSKFHYGLSADFLRMDWQAADYPIPFEQSEWFLDLGINFKGNFVDENSQLGFRPGLGIGFGFLRKMETAGVSNSSYLTLKAFAEIIYFTPGDLIFLFDCGIWYAPSGGDNLTDVKIGPLVFLRGGVMF